MKKIMIKVAEGMRPALSKYIDKEVILGIRSEDIHDRLLFLRRRLRIL